MSGDVLEYFRAEVNFGNAVLLQASADAALGIWCRMVCVPGQLAGHGSKLAAGQWTNCLGGGQKAAFVVLAFSRLAFMQKAAKGKQGVEYSMSWP